VRLYHPDKQVETPVDEDIARARFQAITAAYDVLTGKTTSGPGFGMPGEAGHSPREAMSHATTAAYRAARQRRQELYDSGSVDDTTKDRFIMAGVVLVRLFCSSLARF
jgi:DnaJ-class molecular chaperone